MNHSLGNSISAARIPAAAFRTRQEIATTIGEARDKASGILNSAERQAAQVISAARQEAAETLETLKKASNAEIEAYVAEERERRLGQAMHDAAQFSTQIAEDFNASERWLTDLVMDCVRRIIGEIDETEQSARLIHTALGDLSNRWHLELRAAPADRAKTEEIVKGDPDRFKGVMSVRSDQDLAPGHLRLVSASGISEIGLSAQLSALEAALKSEIATSQEIDMDDHTGFELDENEELGSLDFHELGETLDDEAISFGSGDAMTDALGAVTKEDINGDFEFDFDEHEYGVNGDDIAFIRPDHEAFGEAALVGDEPAVADQADEQSAEIIQNLDQVTAPKAPSDTAHYDV